MPDKTREGVQGVAWRLNADNIQSNARGLIHLKDRNAPDGINLTITTPSLTKLVGRPMPRLLPGVPTPILTPSQVRLIAARRTGVTGSSAVIGGIGGNRRRRDDTRSPRRRLGTVAYLVERHSEGPPEIPVERRAKRLQA